ncbi:AraC family transcriptional regulator [Chitinimonas arctica]|uniref:AraC family transcriptional regulator n=1 Tax=Chitinimonas arctica TaxID=2594795 RepID=A0A516SJ11_9NEIS|nr:AraC family transcriptional regulator [Chitinimonas arctica]QDQ28123.1 AraC family transcriptional regulator [Chitinimonas arctica]
MRKITELSYRGRINRVTAHIEAHLAEPLTGDSLAELAALSRFHFHRMFCAMLGETPAQYVQRRRLHRAVDRLRGSQASVTAIALECGFDSAHALGKALRRSTGMSATALRLAAREGAAHPFRVFRPQPARKDRHMLQPQFKDFPSRTILVATEFGIFDNDAGAAARRAIQRLEQFVDAHPVWRDHMRGCLAYSSRPPEGPNDPDFPFNAAFIMDAPPLLPDGSDLRLETLPGTRCAVFRHIGPYRTLWQTWQAIYRDWLPSADVKLRHQQPWEEYMNSPHDVPPAELVTEICVPVEGPQIQS